MPVPTLLSSLSQTAASNSPAGSESPTTADDYVRALSGFIAQLRDGNNFTDPLQVASAGTTTIGINSMFIEITGTTTITSLGTTYDGPRFLRFTGALTLTHNASTLALPGAANILTAAGDTAIAVPNYGLNGWNIVQYQRAASLGTLESGTSVTASGTSIDFTGIPSWAKRVTVQFTGLSTNGTSAPIVRIGDSGGVEATGYEGSASEMGNAVSPVVADYSTYNGFPIGLTTAAATVHYGTVVLSRIDAAAFLWSAAISSSTGSLVVSGAGAKALTATLDRIRVTTIGGTASFDAGTVNILYE